MDIVWAVIAIIPVVFMAWLAIFLLGNVGFDKDVGPEEDEGHNFTQRPYLHTLVMSGRVADVEKDVRLESLDNSRPNWR
ncbi:hypothetical protein GMORB2_6307 [Geosmithia morbida]|uniref:Uncharacterized protein n=1 Tax=Geosmithia morbida TaxID=1094350 RepID=A0A9P4YV03_9HYPO|nr:uncharacterized protein GMORB2_6307 [Geosmithia morbida]KAF4123606.1 hypothetical protein GMORB2_6307 [Geosmithia morbida]